jgi:hypothetical protein
MSLIALSAMYDLTITSVTWFDHSSFESNNNTRTLITLVDVIIILMSIMEIGAQSFYKTGTGLSLIDSP